ncbi:MAG: ATP synthase F1 subunit delta [Holosporaceae bacterium]|nr:ATP synthase F1 subunit delta [Holosporaceae bacterium]
MTDFGLGAGNSLVGRYARSLHDVSVSLKIEQEILNQIRSLKEYVLAMENHKKILKKNSLLLECGLEFINRLKRDLKLSLEVSTFLGLLHKNKRLTTLIKICEAYIFLTDKENSRETILVVYAKKFPKLDERRLISNMEEILGRRVQCVTQKDPTLIEGIKVRYHSKILDCSIKSKLNRLCNAIVGEHS